VQAAPRERADPGGARGLDRGFGGFGGDGRGRGGAWQDGSSAVPFGAVVVAADHGTPTRDASWPATRWGPSLPAAAKRALNPVLRAARRPRTVTTMLQDRRQALAVATIENRRKTDRAVTMGGRPAVAATTHAPRTPTAVRRRESGVLSDLLDWIGHGTGGSRVVDLVGEAGSGKTHLLGALAEEAAARGVTVLRGIGDRAEWDLRGQLFVQALRGWLGPLGPGPRHDEVLETMRRIATPVAPEASQHGCPGPARLRGLLESHRGGLLLLLDDVHATDPGSLELLDRLVGWQLNAPVALVVSHRPRQDPERLTALLARGAELGICRRLELGPLGLSQAADLLDLPAGSARLRGLHRDARGLPLYLLALSRMGSGHPATDGAAPAGTDDLSQPPRTPVADLVTIRLRTELAPLGADERRLLAGAAVLGDRVDTAGAAAVAQLPETEACCLLDRLRRRYDLLHPVAGSTDLAFRHPLVRWAVYEQADGCWRGAAHRRALAVLAARGATPGVLAAHIERSTPGLDPGDTGVLVAAAREALRTGDSAAADRWTAAALRALGRTRLRTAPEAAQTAGLRTAPGQADHAEAVRGVLAVAEELAVRTGSRRRLAELTAGLGAMPVAPPGGVPAAPASVPPVEAAQDAEAGAAGPLRLAELTDREREIAELASTGMRSRDIAVQFGLSTRTVEAHLARSYRKLGIRSRAALTRMVVESRRAG
jgi:DNA-binding CsgD family transcriptional regulator